MDIEYRGSIPGQILAKMEVLLGFNLTRGGKYKD
jgi:hypothetical protein